MALDSNQNFVSVKNLRHELIEFNQRSSDGCSSVNAYGFGKNKALSIITVFTEKFP